MNTLDDINWTIMMGQQIQPLIFLLKQNKLYQAIIINNMKSEPDVHPTPEQKMVSAQAIHMDQTGNMLNQPSSQQNLKYGQPYIQPDAQKPSAQIYTPSNDILLGPSKYATYCNNCCIKTDIYVVKVPGRAAILWCVGLFLTTVICWFIPFKVKTCYDYHNLCIKCDIVKEMRDVQCCPGYCY